jgi:hypothetical protein
MMKKIFTILLALALVLSFSVVATPVSAQQGYAELVANITAPVNDAAIMGGDDFIVVANVTNNGSIKAETVTATIGITGNAILKAGQLATKVLVTSPNYLAANGTVAVNWTLSCTGAGNVSINVTPSGIDFLTGGLIVGNRLHSNSVIIRQQQILQVAIVKPANFATFNVTNDFEVTANVTNISSLNATGVTLTISIDRYAALKAGEVATRTVEGGLVSNATSTNFTWTVKCTGDGFSRITVTPSGTVRVGGVDKAIRPEALTAATVTVTQGDFAQKDIDLVAGWNLISLPLIPLDSTIDAVLAGILDNVITVWHWDVAIKDWRSFAPGGAPHNLLTMADGKAYWINMKAAHNLTLAGRENAVPPALPPTYDVVTGWNMVGFKSTANNVTAKEYLAGTEYVRIYYFKNSAWYTIPGPSYNTTMVPGLGYWVAFTEPGTIYP